LIVVDSSAWIGHLRDAQTDAVRRLRSLFGRESLAIGDIVLLEVLQGARDEQHAGRLESYLRQFILLQMLDDAIAVGAARNFRSLRARGVTVRKAADLIIGTWCIVNAVPLLHDDRDFTPVHQHLGLQVA
jgi:predicted nucleic acid-binding protein